MAKAAKINNATWSNDPQHKLHQAKKRLLTEHAKKITAATTIQELIKLFIDIKVVRTEAQNISRSHLCGLLGTLVAMKIVAEKYEKEKKALEKLLKDVKIRAHVSENHRLVKYRFPNIDHSTRNRYVRLLDYRDKSSWGVEEFITKCSKEGIQNLVNQYVKSKKGGVAPDKKATTKITVVKAKVTFDKIYKTAKDMVFVIRAVKSSGKNIRRIEGPKADKILKELCSKK